MNITKNPTMQSVYSLELADELKNVGDAYSLMRIFWNTYNNSRIAYGETMSDESRVEGASTQRNLKTVRIQISTNERN
jgi:hypothetical protein